MRLSSTLSALAALVAITALGAGCAVDTSEVGDDTAESADELVDKGAAPLAGTYKDDSGSFRKLVLSDKTSGKGNKFSADVFTGIVCITAPCPTFAHVEGYYTGGSKTLTLNADAPDAQHLLGKYKWTLQGAKLSLTRAGFQQSLEKIEERLDNTCASLSRQECQSAPSCEAQFGPSHCSPNGICTRDIVFKGCADKAPIACEGLDQTACKAAGPACQSFFGPSHCTGAALTKVCTKDFVFLSCGEAIAPIAQPCMSSGACAADEFCTVEKGTCNSTGLLAVCSGTCEKGARKPL